MRTANYEHLFVTHDGEVFNMIEDEVGDMWWGYGHREAAEFTGEVNRWLIHACGVTTPDDLIAASQPVEHLWVRMDDEDGERFSLMHYTMADREGVFPVTRLMQSNIR